MDAGIECQGKVFGAGFQFGSLPAFAGDDAVGPAVDQFQNALSWSGSVIRRR
jgi:hypothetical protein